MAGAEHFRTTAEALASGRAGAVTVGSTASVLEQGLFETAARLRVEEPGLNLSIDELASVDSFAAVQNGSLDLACSNSCAESTALVSHCLMSESLVLIAPTDGVIPSPSSLAGWSGVSFSLFHRDASPELHAVVLAVCRASGADPDFVYRTRTWHSALDAVAAGVSVTVVPRSVGELRAAADSRLHIVEVLDRAPHSELWISRRISDASPLVARVEAAIIAAFA